MSEIIETLQSEINLSYIIATQKRELENNKTALRDHFAYDRKIFDFMFSKLSEEDRQFVLQLKKEQKKIL
jgi:hypothetical protein